MIGGRDAWPPSGLRTTYSAGGEHIVHQRPKLRVQVNDLAVLLAGSRKHVGDRPPFPPQGSGGFPFERSEKRAMGGAASEASIMAPPILLAPDVLRTYHHTEVRAALERIYACALTAGRYDGPTMSPHLATHTPACGPQRRSGDERCLDAAGGPAHRRGQQRFGPESPVPRRMTNESPGWRPTPPPWMIPGAPPPLARRSRSGARATCCRVPSRRMRRTGPGSRSRTLPIRRPCSRPS